MRKFLVVFGGVVSFVICVFILVSQRKDLWIPVAFIANILIFGFLFWIVYNKDEEAREKQEKAKKEEAERAAKMKRVEEALAAKKKREEAELAAKKKREEAELAAKMKLEESISSFSSSKEVQELLKKCIETIDFPVIRAKNLQYTVPVCYDTEKPFIVAHASASHEVSVFESYVCYFVYPHANYYHFKDMGYAGQPNKKKRELFAILLAREIANKYQTDCPDCSINISKTEFNSCSRTITFNFSKNVPNENYRKKVW